MPRRIFALFTWLIAVFLLLVAAAVPALALPRQQRRDYKQQVEALEEQWRQTELANDVAGMDKLLSDDYIGISMTGQIYTKAQQLERMRTKKFTAAQINFDERKVKLIGSIAIVTSRADVEAVNDDVPVKGTFRYTRVYKRLPSGIWQITSFEATRVPRAREQPNQAVAPTPPPLNGR